jgi:hypothetical protein
MTKATIVQKLLENNNITAEEAVILLTNENFNGITYVPYNPPINPMPPFYPQCGQPIWYTNGTVNDTLNSNFTDK